MTSRRVAAALGLVLAIAAHPVAWADLRATETIWDVRDTAQAGQLSIYNSDTDGSTAGMPCASADLDGDGFDEAVLAPFLANAGPANARLRAGKLHIYFGRANGVAGVVDQNAAPAGSVTVHGARAGDNLGCEVDAHDVTGDGRADVLACAQNADGFGASADRTNAGALYILLGRETWPGEIDLAASPEGVVEVLGATVGERNGFWSTAGDVTGDGVGDVLVSADLARSSDGSSAPRGKLYLIPGRATFPPQIDLADAGQRAELDIVEIYGVDDCDHFGSCIAAADFDRDGFDDIAVSAGVSRSGAFSTGKVEEPEGVFCSMGQGGGDGPDETRQDTGEVYVIYGRADWPATIELATPPADVAIYYGQNGGDYFGEDVRAGDFDGDGTPELGVGALTASAPSTIPGGTPRRRSGIGYVFWGSELVRGERLDVRSLPSTNARVTRFYGEAPEDIGADTIALVDVDRDGLAEVVFASPLYDPPGRAGAGDLKIVFGTREPLPGIVDFAAPPASVPVYRVVAADPGDMFAYSFTAGDFDGDSYTDLMPNGMGGDGLGNCCRDAGELYVLSGREFSARAGRGVAPAACLTRAEVVPSAARYFAGQSGIEIRLFCEGGEGFEAGAVAILNGVEVTTQFVSATEVRVRLDDAPSVRNTAGVVSARVRNPGSDASAALTVLTLEGPTITAVKAKRKPTVVRLNIKGTNFLAGATVEVRNAAGDVIATASVTRTNSKKIKATVTAASVPAGAVLTVRVLNPGPAPSAAATVTVP
jgi:hypothetical protein